MAAYFCAVFVDARRVHAAMTAAARGDTRLSHRVRDMSSKRACAEHLTPPAWRFKTRVTD